MNIGLIRNSVLLALIGSLILITFPSSGVARQVGGLSEYRSGTREHPDTGFIMRHPDQYAWEVFCKITQPNKPGSKQPGWDSWTSAFRLFADPKEFNFKDEDGRPQKWSESGQLVADSIRAGAKRMPKHNYNFNDRGDDDQPEDIDLNPVAVNYILCHHLYSQEGQQAMVNAGKPIDFPPGAIEIKTLWRELRTQNALKEYYYEDDRMHRHWGLVSLHLTTKDIPNWFWATFEHESNYKSTSQYPSPPRPFPSTDTWGFSKDSPTPHLIALFRAHHLDPTIWSHYRLGGSQVDYTDAAGRPIIRGNNMIEGRLSAGTPASQSSCMTCHARSTVGQRLDFVLGEDRVGVPKASWFYSVNSEMNMLNVNPQRDFVWSLSRAKHQAQSNEGIFWSIAKTPQLSFADDIYPLFREADIKLMAQQHPPIDLSNPADVKKNHTKLLGYLKHLHKPYLPVDAPQWSGYLTTEFASWASDGGVVKPGP